MVRWWNDVASLLASRGAAGLATGVSGCSRPANLGIPITVLNPAALRAPPARLRPLPPPAELRTGVAAILGTAAWRGLPPRNSPGQP